MTIRRETRTENDKWSSRRNYLHRRKRAHVAGPYAGSLLGDLGCEVIKVELPDGGDTHRGRNPKYEGYGPSFRALNRNKKSLTLNLREKKGREILLKLLAMADILIRKRSDNGSATTVTRLRSYERVERFEMSF
jgi:CoA-transferase family III